MHRSIMSAVCAAALSLSFSARADEPWRSQLEVGVFDLWNFGVFAGGMATTKGASMAYAGFTYDLHITDHILILPDVAVGDYFKGDDKKLSNKQVAEFRSGIGAAYEFDNGWRLGADIHHISNAGLDKRNPGVEIASVTLAVPLFGVHR